MFCDEIIEEVYECINYSSKNVDWRFNCIDELAVHLTKGYRIILKTKTFYICISFDGVEVVPNTENIIMPGEELKCLIDTYDDEPPIIDHKYTLFKGERLIEVVKHKKYYEAIFDDFTLRIVPCDNCDELPSGEIEYLDSFGRTECCCVQGFERLLIAKCKCGGEGEVLLDEFSDFFVRCIECKEATESYINVSDAIDDWNNGERPYLADFDIK